MTEISWLDEKLLASEGVISAYKNAKLLFVEHCTSRCLTLITVFRYMQVFVLFHEAQRTCSGSGRLRAAEGSLDGRLGISWLLRSQPLSEVNCWSKFKRCCYQLSLNKPTFACWCDMWGSVISGYTLNNAHHKLTLKDEAEVLFYRMPHDFQQNIAFLWFLGFARLSVW